METKNRIKIIKGLNKIFSKIKETTRTKIDPKDRKGYMDMANVCMIIPKTVEFKQLLIRNYNVHEAKILNLNYGNTIEDHSVGLNCKYLNVLLNIQKSYEYVKVTARRDMPITFETDDFEFIVAPAHDFKVEE